MNSKQPDPVPVDNWDWVTNQSLALPDLSGIRVVVNGQTNVVTATGFKRRPVYAPLVRWDLRVGNALYLQLANPVSPNASVKVFAPAGLWSSNLHFEAVADPLRFSPAIHVNPEGYLPALPKKGIVGYYLGSLGEMAIPTTQFEIVNAATAATVFQGVLSARPDIGYLYTPTPYQTVFEADFSAVTQPGTYLLVVPGVGASLPFRVDEGIGMAFARTYALGMYHQRSGTNVSMPFTRFVHAADHLGPASVPTNSSAPFTFTWETVSGYASNTNADNPVQTAPLLTNYTAQLFPFINPGPVAVFGGHFEAGDYNRVTYNAAQIIHLLVFAVDSLPGVAALDNLGLPESGDGISDVLQEAKWEADFLAKMQDSDGGFYYSVYPRDREYEYDVLPENGDPEVVWPKNVASTAAAVAALAQCASSPRFKSAYPQDSTNYLAKALLGWKFMTNAVARFGLSGAHQRIQHFDDYFGCKDEFAWAACELFLVKGDAQFAAKLVEWFPDPTNAATFRYGWQRMFACYGNTIRDYAFAVRAGKLSNGQIDPGYLAKCVNVITNHGNDLLSWSENNAYGMSFPLISKAYRGGGWFFSAAWAFDLVVAYELSPDPRYLDAYLHNVNYEAGCNPVNVTYVTGLGWKRMRNVVDQYAVNDHREMPKDGVPISSIQTGFQSTWQYHWELNALVYPPDNVDLAPYPYYDRWCDDWNVSTEGSTTDMARGLAGLAWLAGRTSLASQPWRYAAASIISPTVPRLPNQPVTVTLAVDATNLAAARILWEAKGQEPTFGSQTYSFTLGPDPGDYWIEAEAQWPDGRRAFAVSKVTVAANAAPELTGITRQPNGEIRFTLRGIPSATYIVQSAANLQQPSWGSIRTNTLPWNGIAEISDAVPLSVPARYYRAVQSPLQ